MRSFERKTYMNLIAGPTMERIRLQNNRAAAAAVAAAANQGHHGQDGDDG